MNQPIFGFYHIALMNDWKNVVTSQVNRIVQSGLYKATSQINVCVLGGKLTIDLPDKFKIIYQDENLKKAEYPTLISLEETCNNRENNCLVWYIHTKGISMKKGTKKRWIKERHRLLMEIYMIDQYKKCIEILKNNAACGIFLINNPKWRVTGMKKNPFFARNFWWANSNHIKKLPSIKKFYDYSYAEKAIQRCYCECWVGKARGRLYDLRTHKTMWGVNVGF